MTSLQIFKSGATIFALICGLISYYWLKKNNNKQWIGFSTFLIFLGLFDLFGMVLSLNGYQDENKRFYSFLVIPAQIIVYIYVITKDTYSIGNKGFKISVSIYIIALLIEVILKDAFINYSFMSFSYIIGNIILLVLLLIYFYELTSTNRILDFFNERMFWIALGLLIFWFGSLPYYGLINFLSVNYLTLLTNYCWVVTSLIYIMYCFFMVGLLWAKKN